MRPVLRTSAWFRLLQAGSRPSCAFGGLRIGQVAHGRAHRHFNLEQAFFGMFAGTTESTKVLQKGCILRQHVGLESFHTVLRGMEAKSSQQNRPKALVLVSINNQDRCFGNRGVVRLADVAGRSHARLTVQVTINQPKCHMLLAVNIRKVLQMGLAGGKAGCKEPMIGRFFRDVL